MHIYAVWTYRMQIEILFWYNYNVKTVNMRIKLGRSSSPSLGQCNKQTCPTNDKRRRRLTSNDWRHRPYTMLIGYYL